MITTPDLIKSLAANATPVRRLHPPLVRAIVWLLTAALVLALIGVGHGVRADFTEKAQEAVFVVGVAASLLTGVLAAVAAFMTSLPDRSRLWLLLPAPALIGWLTTVGYGCLTAWVELGSAGIRFGEVAECFATLVLIGGPLSVGLLFMLRHSAPLRPTAAAIMGSLAVAAITATGLLLFHPLDATIMILTWNVGVGVLIIALGSMFGERMLSCFGPRPRPPRS